MNKIRFGAVNDIPKDKHLVISEAGILTQSSITEDKDTSLHHTATSMDGFLA